MAYGGMKKEGEENKRKRKKKDQSARINDNGKRGRCADHKHVSLFCSIQVGSPSVRLWYVL